MSAGEAGDPIWQPHRKGNQHAHLQQQSPRVGVSLTVGLVLIGPVSLSSKVALCSRCEARRRFSAVRIWADLKAGLLLANPGLYDRGPAGGESSVSSPGQKPEGATGRPRQRPAAGHCALGFPYIRCLCSSRKQHRETPSHQQPHHAGFKVFRVCQYLLTK